MVLVHLDIDNDIIMEKTNYCHSSRLLQDMMHCMLSISLGDKWGAQKQLLSFK